LDNENLEVKIPLPDGCKYEFKTIDPTNFTQTPKYDPAKKELVLKLKPNVCFEKITIYRNCDDDCDSTDRFDIALYGFNPSIQKQHTTCEGLIVKFSHCGSGSPYGLIKFELIDAETDEVVEVVNKSSGSITVGKSGQYKYRFLNMITEPPTKLVFPVGIDDELEITAGELYFPFTIENIRITKEVLEPDAEGKFKCRFDIKFRATHPHPFSELDKYLFSIRSGSQHIHLERTPLTCSYETSIEVDCSEFEDGKVNMLIEVGYPQLDGKIVCSKVIEDLYCFCSGFCDSLEAQLAGIPNVLVLPGSPCEFPFNLPAGYTLDSYTFEVSPPPPNFSFNNFGNWFKIEMSCWGSTGSDEPEPNDPSSKTTHQIVKMTISKNGETCILTKMFVCSCPAAPPPPPDVRPEYSIGGFVEVNYDIPDEYLPFEPFYFYLNDNFGNKLKLLTVTEELTGQFDFNMPQYPTGTYHITLETIDDRVLASEQFMHTK